MSNDQNLKEALHSQRGWVISSAVPGSAAVRLRGSSLQKHCSRSVLTPRSSRMYWDGPHCGSMSHGIRRTRSKQPLKKLSRIIDTRRTVFPEADGAHRMPLEGTPATTWVSTQKLDVIGLAGEELHLSHLQSTVLCSTRSTFTMCCLRATALAASSGAAGPRDST